MKNSLWYLGLLTILIFSQCNDKEIVDTLSSSAQFDKGQLVSRTIAGTILNEFGDPMPNAEVNLGQLSETTDEEGQFIFINADVLDKHVYVTCNKVGYVNGSRSFMATSGINNVVIKMLRKNLVGTVQAATGGVVGDNNSTIEFAPGFINARGVDYEGPVYVYVSYLDPTADDIDEIMPGSLRAVDQGDATYLRSLGMLNVELEGSIGQELQLAPGSKAQIEMSIPQELESGAPETIQLWHFDEDEGYWVSEGEATKNDNKYVGEVSHFSFWNLDIKVDNTTAYGKVVGEDGSTLVNAKIHFASSTAGSRSSRTCSQGKFGGIMPANDELEVIIISDDLLESYTTVIPALSSSITRHDLPDIVIPNSSLKKKVKVSGQLVDCDLENSDGIVNIGAKYFETSNGAFELMTLGNTTLRIKGLSFDRLNGQVLTVETKVSDLNVGNISLCDEVPVVWISDFESFEVSYSIKDAESQVDFNLDNLSIAENLETGTFRVKAGASNGSTGFAFLDFVISDYEPNKKFYTFHNVPQSDLFNIYIPKVPNGVLSEYSVQLAISRDLDISPGHTNTITFYAYYDEHDPVKNEWVQKSIRFGKVTFKL